jgi:hypothetical protein
MIGDVADADQGQNDDDWIDSEDPGRHGVIQVPFIGIEPISQRRRGTGPERVGDHAGRPEKAGARAKRGFSDQGGLSGEHDRLVCCLVGLEIHGTQGSAAERNIET